MNLKKIGIVLFLSVFAPFTFETWASDIFPEKSIQLVVPFPPGGSADFISRLIAEKMHGELGQPVVVLNKPGAGTSIATSYVGTSKPDGHTILLTASGAFLILPLAASDTPYKTSDFIPIGRTAFCSFVVAVNKSSSINNMQQLEYHIKKNPGTFSYGGSTIAATQQLLGELFKQRAKLDIQYIPQGGENPNITALMGNHILFGIFTLPSCLPHLRSGALRGIAVTSAKRDAFIPDIPTCVEQGFPEMIALNNFILLAPVKTPSMVIKKLESFLEKALQDKQLREKIGQTFQSVEFLNSKETQNFLEAEGNKWAKVIKAAGITVK